MKYLIISDIHGSTTALKRVLEYFDKWHCDNILLLGDILYHGPRNDLPEGYAPKEVAAILNNISDKILAVRGNCEAEVDQMVLNFPCMAEYAWVVDNGIRIFMTHGHHFNPDKLPPIGNIDVFMYGHTHLYQIEKKDNIMLYNPGSISIPKGGNVATFGLWNNGRLSIYNLDGEEIFTEHY